MSSTAFALVVQSDPAINNPGSTENLWAYSYDANASYIVSASDFVRAGDSYITDSIFQGYVTGDFGPWSGSNESWGSGGISDGNSVHVFDIYISSAIDQTVKFLASGDDGKSFFVDDIFLNGSGFYPASNVTEATLDMVANTLYKLTYIGSNWSGGFGWWFNMSGTDTSGAAWVGPVSEAYNITMNAVAGSPDPVPEPATIFLFGTGLIGLAGIARRKKK